METLLRFVPSAATIVAVILALVVLQRLLERGAAVAEHRFRNQIVLLLATGLGLFLIILVAPLGDALRGQLLSLIGIVLSAGIALSSTTFLGNAMAGIMMRAVKNFRMGDFIRVEGHFGRVSERGLFHTEIQTEDRELTTLPNLYLVTNPVTTLRSSGTIVFTKVSLGYDVPRQRVEECLLDAAARTNLSEPFVQVMQLGDFSVTYRIAGLLPEVKKYVSTRARLRANVMDALHEGGVEIVSPNFMNHRQLPADEPVIPAAGRRKKRAPEAAPEDLLFDKADDAESLESLIEARRTTLAEVEQLEAAAKAATEGPERDRATADLERARRRAEHLAKLIEERESDSSNP